MVIKLHLKKHLIFIDWGGFVIGCRQMDFDDESRKAVLEIRKSTKVVLITGNTDCFSRFTVPILGLTEVFDEIRNSFEF